MNLVQYRILVTGWRFWPREAAYVIQGMLDVVSAPSLAAGQEVLVREGQCPYGGADDYANEWAVVHASPLVHADRVPAAWDVYGRVAGRRRNQAMVDRGNDICVGFPGPPARKNSGTLDCMRRAGKAGILVVAVPWTDWFLTDPERFDPAPYVDLARTQDQLFWTEGAGWSRKPRSPRNELST